MCAYSKLWPAPAPIFFLLQYKNWSSGEADILSYKIYWESKTIMLNYSKTCQGAYRDAQQDKKETNRTTLPEWLSL